MKIKSKTIISILCIVLVGVLVLHDNITIRTDIEFGRFGHIFCGVNNKLGNNETECTVAETETNVTENDNKKNVEETFKETSENDSCAEDEIATELFATTTESTTQSTITTMKMSENRKNTKKMQENSTKVIVDTTKPSPSATKIAADTTVAETTMAAEKSTSSTVVKKSQNDTKPKQKKNIKSTAETSTQKQEKANKENISYNFPIHYSDDTGSLDIKKIKSGNTYCYVAHLKFTDYKRFGSDSAYGKYCSGFETTSAAASRLKAVFCVNGDYSAYENNYGTLRHGTVANDRGGNFYPEGVYNSYTGQFGNKTMLGIGACSATYALNNHLATDTFQFAPAGLVNGVVLTPSSNTTRAQRTAIGTNGKKGDIIIVVSEGRYSDSVSPGLTCYETMKLLKDQGCVFGVMLDGGGSSTMVYRGKVLNTVYQERAVLDFLYFK